MASNPEAMRKQQDLQTQYSNYKNTLQSLAQKVGEIEQEIEEHKQVPQALDGRQKLIEGNRKCFRLINGVLVERTIEDVLPALSTNSDGLKQVLEELVKQYKAKQDELDKWKAEKEQHSSGAELSLVNRCFLRQSTS
ncbi:uncharacterized protein HMPREF1541_08170 [Cyphellophora europaea CBS 101466]|uniref:Prefoldin subunit 2 n=1 Tax=Cyphellophora europaea (strain CBS 101466) TaxID=1220924 RepID=W2RLI3_CYPE1|nr:uncharacterized protein HMPREF1541_08170 [Cyphellophora europaea CBS 101466]ETN37180.1 hypothetical protein HMPREF1541_08170 [Cyphellophora europaea CBS 101466]